MAHLALTFLRGLTIGVVLSFSTAPAEAQNALAGISYSPSSMANEAELLRGPSIAMLRADLQPLAQVTRRIRTYSVDHGLDAAVPAAHSFGLVVSLGLWLGKDATENERELARGLETVRANPDSIDRIFVGNETVERGDLSVEAITAYIARVRADVPRTIAVGTAEPWPQWIKHPELAAASEFIGAHIFPYWDGVPVSEAVRYVARRYDELRRAFPGKKIVIAETGWPAAGATNQAAVPSAEAQAGYLRAFLRQATAAHYDYYLFEAYDQPWKAAREGGEVGASWGVIDARRRFKFPLF